MRRKQIIFGTRSTRVAAGQYNFFLYLILVSDGLSPIKKRKVAISNIYANMVNRVKQKSRKVATMRRHGAATIN